MGSSSHPSTVTMPRAERPYPSVLDFLCLRFGGVPRVEWERRIAGGRVLDEAGLPMALDRACSSTAYSPGKRLFYFRDNPLEPAIPFAESILFRDEHLLVADKPHFLPVVPSGPYVEECLLARLRRSTGIADLAPLHRIDRETAGLVLFSASPRTRGLYADLFRAGAVEKDYLAISASIPRQGERSWLVEDRLGRGEPFFCMKRVPGPVNARSIVELVGIRGNRSRFRLRPLTGKKHQLRLHMGALGFSLLNDRCYPELQAEGADDFSAPLQLLAQGVRFRDPLTGASRGFFSARELAG